MKLFEGKSTVKRFSLNLINLCQDFKIMKQVLIEQPAGSSGALFLLFNKGMKREVVYWWWVRVAQ